MSLEPEFTDRNMAEQSWLASRQRPVPENEDQRLEALYQYMGPDKEPETDENLIKLARLASEFCDVPIVFVNLIDEDKEYKHACFGFKGQNIPRSDSFCQFAIMQDDIYEIRNVLADPLFKNNPNVGGELQVRYYAAAPLKTPGGLNIGTLCLIDRKPNELTQPQKRALKTLADEVVSRLELNRLNRKLDQMNRDKDELMKIVSHDMRNPLMGIIGFSEYLYQETDDDEKKEVYSIMEDAGKHLLGIVNVMLNSEYFKNEPLRLSRKMVDVAAITREVIVLHQPYALLKEQYLSTDLPDTLSFKVDPERWKNIIGNLISNALKFTPRNGRIYVSLTVNEAKKQVLVLRVQDSGIGMSEEQIRQLYSGNTSQHRTGTEGEETSGLGMLFIKKSVELHRGKISVDSTPGKGTCFTIEIPE